MTMVIRGILAACCAGAALALSTNVQAIPIQYAVTALPVPGNYFRYEYTVSNDGSLPGGVDVELFDIEFDPGLYNLGSLTIVSPGSITADWEEILLPPVVGGGSLYDVLARLSGIAAGSSVSGFAVEFQWLGSGSPGAQNFFVYDAATFDLLASGRTTARDQPPQPAPEPASLLLACTAVAVAVCSARRRKVTPEFDRQRVN